MHSFRALAVLAVLAVATPAFAQAKLVESTPRAGAKVAPPGKIVLVFDEKLNPTLAGATLTMMSMPGMTDHAPMKMTGFTSAISADGKTLTLLMKRALPRGTYDLGWFAGGVDGQRKDGTFSFTVK